MDEFVHRVVNIGRVVRTWRRTYAELIVLVALASLVEYRSSPEEADPLKNAAKDLIDILV